MGLSFISFLWWSTHLYENENFQVITDILFWVRQFRQMTLITSKKKNYSKFIYIHAAYSVAESRRDVSHNSIDLLMFTSIRLDSQRIQSSNVSKATCDDIFSRLWGARKETKIPRAIISTLKRINEYDSYVLWW